jgi:hypothetical protein
MKKSFFSWHLTFAAMLAFSLSAFAQHSGAGGWAADGSGARLCRCPFGCWLERYRTPKRCGLYRNESFEHGFAIAHYCARQPQTG